MLLFLVLLVLLVSLVLLFLILLVRLRDGDDIVGVRGRRGGDDGAYGWFELGLDDGAGARTGDVLRSAIDALSPGDGDLALTPPCPG